MAALKKSSIALLLVLGIMLGVNVASAQIPSQSLGVVTCQATAVPPVVRAEGIAEIVGDIVLVCQNIPPGAGLGDPTRNRIVTNVSVSLNVNITNNINYGKGTNVTDAVLIINENNCVDPAATGSVFAAGCTTPDGRFQDPQLGTLAANNRLEWNQVDFPVPGGSATGIPVADCTAGGTLFPGELASGCFPFTTSLRITSLRANASQLGVPETATFPSTQITAFVSITGPTTIPVTNNVLNVAVPILGLIVTGPGAVTGLQCIDGDESASITLREGFATAFKTLGVPTFLPGNTQWESGYYAPGSNNGGGASQATRFILRFFNVPEGVTLTVPNYVASAGLPLPVTSDNLELYLVPSAGANGAGGSASLGTTSGTTTVTLSGGFGQAVYEVHDSNPFAVESVTVPLGVSWESDTSNDLPAIGSGQISVSFAPISTVATANAAAPEPRFVDTSGDPRNFISILRCTTTLLFPFATNQAGFDTGMAISNTSEDWLGTDPQTGACTIHYHGETVGGGAAPPEQTSTAIAGGEQLIFTLSGGNPAQGIDGAPDFQGYVIAVCDFQYAHGFAFITDGYGSVPALAQGYLALVIPVTPDHGRIAGVPGLHNYAEVLAH